MPRINRATYWLLLALFIAGFAIAWISLHPRHLPITVAFVLLSQSRLHDIGRTGWFSVGFFIPGIVLETLLHPAEGAVGGGALVEIALLVLAILAGLSFLGVIPGQPGANRFGRPSGRGLRW